jgi:hypothetical protein
MQPVVSKASPSQFAVGEIVLVGEEARFEVVPTLNDIW